MRRDCVAQRLEAPPRSPSLVDKNHTLRSRAVNGRNGPIADTPAAASGEAVSFRLSMRLRLHQGFRPSTSAGACKDLAFPL